jgi:hypothetical protein
MGILLQFLATKALAPILGGIVLLTMGEHPVSLSKPDVEVAGDTLFISTRINNGFSKELNEIIRSGVPVTFRLTVRAEDEIDFVRVVSYDIEGKVYYIEDRFTDDATETEDEKEMQTACTKFERIYLMKEKIPPSNTITIRASLDPVTLDFLDDEVFDLMTLWNYRSPQQTIEVKKQ